MSTPSLPLLTAANWYLWEQQALNCMTIFCHGPWNDATDWPLNNKAKEDYHSSILQYRQHRQALWSFLLTHIDSDVDHLIKLHVDYSQAALDIDTDKLWIILRQSVTQNGSFNVSEIKIEWANYKQSLAYKILEGDLS